MFKSQWKISITKNHTPKQQLQRKIQNATFIAFTAQFN